MTGLGVEVFENILPATVGDIFRHESFYFFLGGDMGPDIASIVVTVAVIFLHESLAVELPILNSDNLGRWLFRSETHRSLLHLVDRCRPTSLNGSSVARTS